MFSIDFHKNLGCLHRYLIRFTNFLGIPILVRADLRPLWDILANAFAQSNRHRKAFVCELSPAVITLLMLYNASAVPFFFLNPYCVFCNSASIPSSSLLWIAAAIIL